MQYIFIFLISVFLFTTNCDQKYAYLGTTKGTYTTTFWIQEDVGGECSYTDLDEIIIDTGSMVHHVENNFSGDSTATRRFLKTNLNLVPTNEIRRSANGSFSVAEDFAFSEPADDSMLRAKFYADFYSAHEWNKAMGNSGMVMPVVSKGKLKKLYASPDGFYVDYTISRVWYTPSEKLLLVFTRSSQFGGGMDTMHGYLIFRVESEK